MAAESSGEEMDDHSSQLSGLCRLCGGENEGHQTLSTKYMPEFLKLFGIDLSADIANIHPTSICHKCRCVFDRYKNHKNQETFQPVVKPYTFKQHDNSCNICFGHTTDDHSYHSVQKRGRKKKLKRTGHAGPGRGGKRKMEERDMANIEADVSQAQTCSTQTDTSNLTEMGTQTDSTECGYIIDADEPDISEIPLPLLCKLVKTAAQSQRHDIYQDTSTVSHLHRDPQTLISIDPIQYYSNRNSLCTSFVDGLANQKTTVASKVMTVEQLYHLVSPVVVAPFTFTRNLLCYAITNSKLAVNMLGKVSAGGMIDTVKSYMENIAAKPLPFPGGDAEVAIDNDQKLKKQWSVRAQGKMAISVLTSVCQVEHGPQMDVQSREDLSPASWGDYMKKAREDEKVADQLRLSLKPSKKTEDLHPAEVRKVVHERLAKVANEQRLQEGQWVDYIDVCVADREKKKDTKQCSACGTEVAKTKRLCTNAECQANLKAAEQAAAGKNTFGTMLLAPVRKYNYRPKETEIVFSVESEHHATLAKQDKTVITSEEYADIPSHHPHSPPPITMSDPVFVNPNSASTMRKVLRHVGKISNIARYNDQSPSTRKWVVVAMDGLPLGITRNIINDTMYCSLCKMSFDGMDLFSTHIADIHPGEDIPEVREFDWVVLRVGKLHLEMNALKAFVDLNWEVWFAALAEEMGFQSEGAQRVAKNCADHHKSMELLQIAIKGTTDELLLPYVRQKLEKGEQHSMSAVEFLYDWSTENVRNPNYLFLLEQIKQYGLAIQNFRVGTRRNNTDYIKAGVEVFSPLFSGRNHPKYQSIDIFDSLDRAMYPDDLKNFMEKTEAVSSGSRSHGEGMDAKLEEKNKASKAWHRGAPLAADWVRVFRNLDVLQELRAKFFDVIGVAETVAAERSTRYKQEPEVDTWRTRLRASKYLSDPFNGDVDHTSITGKPLTANLLDFDKIARSNKMMVFNGVLLEGKQRSDIRQTIVHVTEEERSRAEDITKQTKVIIVEKTKELLSQFVVDHVQSYYQEKLCQLEKKINSTKKDDLLQLYYEIYNESSEQENIRYAVESDEMEDTS